MTPRQQRTLDELREAHSTLRRYDGWCLKKIEADEFFPAVLEEYDRAVGTAIRAGLMDHPEVSPWLTAHRALGQRHLLRKTRKGLETGVERPQALSDVLLENEALPLIAAGCKPESTRDLVISKLLALAAKEKMQPEQRQAARALASRLARKRMSRQAWHKRYKWLASLLES